ncbi:MAG TPA: hypothetical protein VMF08_13325 [Candidatus Sulfotelmatobacter sp.]|nr:hypothetical protein [Candidatus Sulfotelmatobacter sp.]
MNQNVVAQVSKPAVSPISKSADRAASYDDELKTRDAKRALIWNAAAYDVLRPAGSETCDTADLEVCATAEVISSLFV